MTDRTVVFRKLSSLREHVARMRRRRPDDIESFRSDIDRQDAVGMSLLVAVQDALDIAMHMATLRNRLAHGYGTVDMDRIWAGLPDGLAALDAFASAIAARLDPG